MLVSDDMAANDEGMVPCSRFPPTFRLNNEDNRPRAEGSVPVIERLDRSMRVTTPPEQVIPRHKDTDPVQTDPTIIPLAVQFQPKLLKDPMFVAASNEHNAMDSAAKKKHKKNIYE